MTYTASDTTKAFYSLPADIQAIALARVGKPARPMSHMEIMLAIGEEVLRERERCAQWQPIETAPHETNVLLAWPDSTLPGGWKVEAGMASWGWRRDGVSNMSEHGQATHWQPLPAPPAQEGGKE